MEFSWCCSWRQASVIFLFVICKFNCSESVVFSSSSYRSQRNWNSRCAFVLRAGHKRAELFTTLPRLSGPTATVELDGRHAAWRYKPQSIGAYATCGSKSGVFWSKRTWACFNLERYGTIMARQQKYDWRVLFCHLDFTNVATAANKQQNDLEREPHSGNGHQVG